jgi:hypothetical protein
MSTGYLNYITLAGLDEEALAKEEGRKVTIEKVVIGLGLLPENEQPQNQTALLQPKAEAVCFVKAIDTEHGFYRVEADIPIPDEGYNYFEIGSLTDTGVLYSYARSRGDYVAGSADSDGKLTRIRLNFRTDNSELITITQDDSVLYTPITDFEAHVEDFNDHVKADKAHEQYERKDNAATDADIDSESKEKKHVKLPQLWRALTPQRLIDKLWLGLAAKIFPVGAAIPWFTDIAPNGFAIMKNQVFDKIANPQCALIWPDGIIPDMRGCGVIGKEDGETIGVFEEGQVKEHGHEGSSVGSTNLGTKTTNTDTHYHTYAKMRPSYSNQHGKNPWTTYGTETRNTSSDSHNHTVVIGSHVHTIMIALFGALKNTINHRKVNWIVRLA